MSSTQYIKIFNDTVLKQSILQGYETQRTDSTLGKFTMGELAFTRDTGRVFVGTYTDDKKSSDIAYQENGEDKPGGLLVGNKYYGSSNDGKTLTHYPSYNSKYGVYNGDYTFDKSTSSLILFDKTIEKSNNVKDIICDDGFIRMRILEPDGDTITYDRDETTDNSIKNTHNVLKADFTTERFFKLLSNDTFETITSSDVNNGKITLKNVKLTSKATLELPNDITIRCDTKDKKEVQKSISFSEITDENKFPTFILCAEPQSQNEYQIQYKPYSEVIDITGEGNIVVENTAEGTDGNKHKFVIKYVENPNPDNINGGDTDNDIQTITFPDITQTPWNVSDGYFYSGNSIFSIDGKLAAVEAYGNTSIKTKDENGKPLNPKDGEKVQFEYVGISDEDEDIKALNEATLAFIKNNYIGGVFNIGLNYLKTPLDTFYTFVNEDDEEPTEKQISSYLSGQEICIENLFTKYNSQYPRIIPSHAQSIILQVSKSSTTTTTASVKLSNGTTLFETNDNKFTTTVEVPLYIQMKWDVDVDEQNVKTTKAVSYKYFNISFSNCAVKLLGYRV